MGALVFAEQHDGVFTPGSLGLIAEAARLGGQVDAVVCGSGHETEAQLDRLAALAAASR